MIIANASTAADDLGVAASGNAAIEGALENDAPSSAAPCVISPTGIPTASSCYKKSGGAAEEGSIFS